MINHPSSITIIRQS